MTPAEVLSLLEAFHRDTLDLLQTHLANARSITDYDINNAYQQVLGRQEVHLRWLADAIEALGGAAPSPEPSQASQAAASLEATRALAVMDEQHQRQFLQRWTPRVAEVTHARHRLMLELILGEAGEHLRIFQQAVEGRSDLIGRHVDGKVLRGKVMAARPRN